MPPIWRPIHGLPTETGTRLERPILLPDLQLLRLPRTSRQPISPGVVVGGVGEGAADGVGDGA